MHHDEYQEYVKTPFNQQPCPVCKDVGTYMVRFRSKEGSRVDLQFCNLHSKNYENFILNHYGISKPYW